MREKSAKVLLPVYGIYRCHNCNWRGWLPRGSTSPMMRRLLVALYTTLLILLLAFAAALLIEKWPKPHYEYPGSAEPN
ncbi:MAG: hypothetical protein H7X80_07675 [bacterium]|nr:hypothetical protein [Candidatus Kapabacteria bacterium]